MQAGKRWPCAMDVCWGCVLATSLGGYEGMVSISMAWLFFVRCCVFDGITLSLWT